jgi:uncharacterized LabA/DUF88 family protein
VSKNVAVFVDVANIFYAAKAAGVDIDYVTLLKSATAGRDLVRAYAYTGLDPENENQKNFHEFLKRSGYKVVSKDIRKYGDGRIKANLDIELVVDLMRLAQHIDIAVVISGDGDFAPAIKAVQQMGVRVDVISFSGNTSSDLKEVADDFYEITHLAKVEKGARSGRRVASATEDDLSMTAVPEKETDMGPRRRRGGTGRGRDRDERGGRDRGDREPREVREIREPREPRGAAADAGLPGNVIVLPGERLSRAAQDVPEDVDLDEEVLEGAEIAADGEAEGEAGEGQGEGRRRRRRRGGRGRGRGRRAEGEGEGEGAVEGAPAGEADAAETDEEVFLEEELPTMPQHSTFGSVWDTQIGLPKQPVTTATDADDEEYDDEPEIPEYLLAERRQQARGNRGGRNRGGRSGGNRSGGGYQSAIDRERFGRSGPALFTGAGGNRQGGGDRNRGGGGDRNRQGGGDRNQGQNRRPQPAPAPRERVVTPVTSSSEPWSEVPPEVQELLRAELARRQPAKAPAAAPAPKAADAPTGRGGRRSPKPAAAPEPVEAPVAEVTAPVEEPAAKPTRRRTTKAVAEAPVADALAAEAPAEEPAPKPARKRTTKAAAPAEAPAAEAPAEEPAPKPARKRTTKAAAPAEAPAAEETPAEEPKKPARKRTTKAAAEPAEG